MYMYMCIYIYMYIRMFCALPRPGPEARFGVRNSSLRLCSSKGLTGGCAIIIVMIVIILIMIVISNMIDSNICMFMSFEGSEGRQRAHHGHFDADVFASEQLWRDKEVTIETVVGPFSC